MPSVPGCSDSFIRRISSIRGVSQNFAYGSNIFEGDTKQNQIQRTCEIGMYNVTV